MSKNKCSIIIRTKNEERWISNCLEKIFSQSYKYFEVIIVDNQSTDKTVIKSKQFPIKKIIKVDDYFPGHTLNEGIRNSCGDYVVCLSAHCIPVNEQWLEILINSLEENKSYAGVYGRQQPMSFSSPSDKRDLLNAFGLERKIQKNDSFFHNANSIIRRTCWHECNFDEKLTNIEDRFWAQAMLNKGYQILYEPTASVYHYHGIHQNGNLERLNHVVKIVEENNLGYRPGYVKPINLNICAIIPKKGLPLKINQKYQIEYTIETLKNSKYVNEVIVSTDNKKTLDIVKALGVKSPFLRDKNLSKKNVNLEKVYAHTVNKIEEKGIFYDLIVLLEETFPFRPKNLIDGMIEALLNNGFDCIIASKKESGWIWQEDKQKIIKRIDKGDIPRKFKNLFLGMHGLGIVTYPNLIRENRIFEYKTGLFETDSLLSNIEIRTKKDIELLKPIFDQIHQD